MSSAQGLVSVEALSRRAAIRRIALGVTAAGLGAGIDRADAAQVHAEVESVRTFKGEYKARYFNDHEFSTLERLSELIVPADEGGPSGREGGAPEFIDLLSSQNAELASTFTGGILWLDAMSRARNGNRFVDASEKHQTDILDALVEAERSAEGAQVQWATDEYKRFSVFGTERPPEAQRGLTFFGWSRQLIVDAYYTSPAGIKDLGFLGNASHTEYKVPQEAIEHARARSPFEVV